MKVGKFDTYVLKLLSIFFQFERFLELRNFIDEKAKSDRSYKVTAAQWHNIELVKNVLHEPYALTLALQQKKYTLSCFFGDWLKTKRNLEKSSHELGQSILKHMHDRESTLLDNKLMLSSVFLDPRYNFLLSEVQKQNAVIHLCELWCRIDEMSSRESNREPNLAEVDDFAQYLSVAGNGPDPSNIRSRIELFLTRPSIHYKTDIFDYWDKIRLEEPELYKLRIALFSVAVTQVDVERSFSSLQFVFNNFRSRLSVDVLSQLLILRLNSELVPRTLTSANSCNSYDSEVLV